MKTVLKSLLSVFTHTKIAPVKYQTNVRKVANPSGMICFGEFFSFTEIRNMKSWSLFSSFNPIPSLPSVTTRQQIVSVQIV